MNPHWQPTATVQHLKHRAHIIEKMRAFFKAREVIEVETPLLCRTTATDPYIESFETFLCDPGGENRQKFYLQTSPEFPMKRLLAAGMGSIYQICKAFRNEESGRLHNPEFTILEWYRLGFDHHQLMDEVDHFLQYILRVQKAQRVSYQQIFLNYLQINPHEASIFDLQRCAAQQNLLVEAACLNRDDWLQLLMMHCIEPHLGQQMPVFIYDFPASQAALSKIRQGEIPVAERFEVYVEGVELANGYHELCHAKEQQERFKSDHVKRQVLSRPEIPLDAALIAALEHGMPDCAGIALGVDRLVMLALQQNHIADVVAFPVEVA